MINFEGGQDRSARIIVVAVALLVFMAPLLFIFKTSLSYVFLFFVAAGILLLGLRLLAEMKKTGQRLQEESFARKRLEDSTDHFTKALETMQIGVTITDAEGRILYVNRAEAEMHGYTPEELTRKDVKIFAPPEFWETTTPEQVRDMKSWRRESVNVRKDGFIFPVELISEMLPVVAGQPLRILTTCHDITARKHMEQELKEAKDRYRGLIENAQDIIATVAPDGTISSLNQAFESVTGWLREDWLGRHYGLLVHRDDLLAATDLFQRLLRGEQVSLQEFRILAKDANYISIEFTATPIFKDGEVSGVLTISRDVTARKLSLAALRKNQEELEVSVEERTAQLEEVNRELLREIRERKRIEEVLRRSEERYALALRGAQDGLWDWDLETNAMYYSPRWKWMLGYEQDEIGNSPEEWFSRIHSDDVEKVKVEIFAHLEGLTPHFQNEHRVLHKDLSYRWMLSRGSAVRDKDGKALRIAGSLTDIAERKRSEAELEHQAFYDPLTDLPNRALFMDRLGQVLKRANRRRDNLFALLYIDLDYFKDVNDTYGHVTGDLLLAAVARKLEECLRPSDTVARFGGDEFTILLDDVRDVNDVTLIAGRVSESLKAPFHLNGKEILISASIGIALNSKSFKSVEEILHEADMAMYRAKELGRGRHQISTDSVSAP